MSEFISLRFEGMEAGEKAFEILESLDADPGWTSACEIDGDWCIEATDEEEGHCDGTCDRSGVYIRVESKYCHLLKALQDVLNE